MNSHEFEEIVAQHHEPLYKFAYSLTRLEADACDLTQQTFYVWATKGHQLRERSRVKTWLFTTLYRLFLETQRRQARFPHHHLEEVYEQLPTHTPRFDDRVDSSIVLSALARIDLVYQGAVALFYLEDCSYKEIALILEMPIGTVKSRVARGIGQLRNLLLSDGPSDSRLNPDVTGQQNSDKRTWRVPRKHGSSPLRRIGLSSQVFEPTLRTTGL